MQAACTSDTGAVLSWHGRCCPHKPGRFCPAVKCMVLMTMKSSLLSFGGNVRALQCCYPELEDEQAPEPDRCCCATSSTRTRVSHHCPCRLSAFCSLAPPAACPHRTGHMRYPAHRQTATAGEHNWGAAQQCCGAASASRKRSPEPPGSSSCCWQRGSAPHSGRSSLQTTQQPTVRCR